MLDSGIGMLPVEDVKCCGIPGRVVEARRHAEVVAGWDVGVVGCALPGQMVSVLVLQIPGPTYGLAFDTAKTNKQGKYHSITACTSTVSPSIMDALVKRSMSSNSTPMKVLFIDVKRGYGE